MGTTPICFYCGRPILGAAIYGFASEPYHAECASPPRAPEYATRPSGAGCRPARYVTEQEVREIVREEIALALAEPTDDTPRPRQIGEG